MIISGLDEKPNENLASVVKDAFMQELDLYEKKLIHSILSICLDREKKTPRENIQDLSVSSLDIKHTKTK